MPCKLRGMSVAALVGFAVVSSPTLAADWSRPSDGSVRTVQFLPQKKNVIRKPQYLPPNPCKNQVCAIRPRPR
jgi:hypothetical protein